MQRNILQGSEFLLYNIENEPVAYSTNCVLKINQNLSDVTHKDSDSWSEFMVGLKNWSIDFDGLVSYGDGFNTSFFLSKFKNPEPFFIKFGIVQENFTHAFVGEVNIESIEQTADDGEVVAYSGTLKGIGNLSFQDEGTPIQNGYIKVEQDPVFRGSPAFNISETDKHDWNQAYSKIVNELEFLEEIDKTTLKIKFKDGTYYSSSFKPVVPVVDLSGYYTKAQADSKILVAQVAADQANNLLSAIASDSKLTPSEKPNVLKEWQIIQDEKDKLVAQAVTAYVQTIEYDIVYLDLERYLEPLLESMLTTTSIIGYEFRAYFRNYYEQKILLLKSISKAQVDNVKIGVRNYHFNGDKAVLVFDTANQLLQQGNYPLNSQMAISFMARSIDGTSKLYLEFEGKEPAQFNVTADWIDCSCVINTGDVAALYARIGGSTSIFNIRRFIATAYDTFPYLFPMSFDGTDARNGIEIKNIMVVQGNKPTSFVPAPEDFKELIDKAKLDASKAAKAYSDLQIELNNTIISAEFDGKIDESEARLIADATSKLDAAKAYADATALNAKILANGYADGLIDDIEARLLNASDTNIAAAKAYTDSQRTLSEINLKAYADGKIDSTEAALIQNATNNLVAAKAYSDAQDLYTKTLSDSYADHLISEEEQKRLDAVQASLNAAKLFTTTQRALSETITKAYADGVVDAEEARAIADATNKMNEAKQDATNKIDALKIGGKNLLIDSSFERGIITSDPNTIYDATATNAQNAVEGTKIVYIEGTGDCYVNLGRSGFLTEIGEQYTISYYLKLAGAITYTSSYYHMNGEYFPLPITVTPNKWVRVSMTFTANTTQVDFLRFGFFSTAYAWMGVDCIQVEKGNKSTDWRPHPEDDFARVEKSITDKANEIIANTTSQINVANTAILQQAKSDAESKIEIARLAAISASNSYTTAQRIAAETTAQVYADGIVTAEEQARLTQAFNNLQAAKQDATEKANTAAEYGIAAQNLHNALVGNLKGLAYQDVIQVATLGDTIVQGGFLKTSLLDANYIKSGIINSDYIKTLDLQTNQLSTTGVHKITLNQNNDNMLKFRHQNGVVGIEIGIVSGQLKIIFYDTNGLIVWEGGKSGIIYINEMSEAWVTLYRRQITIGDNFYDGNGQLKFDGESLRSLVTDTTSSGLASRGDYTGDHRLYTLNMNALSTSYQYNAGQNANISINNKYTGIHTSQTKSLANWVEDGWYLEDSSLYGWYPSDGHSFDYSMVAVKNGKDIGRVSGQLTGLTLN